MAIPAEQSWGDLAAGLNIKAWADAGASLAFDGARGGQSHQNRVSAMQESVIAGWANLLISNDAREAAADRATLTGRESMNIGESVATIGTLAKIFDRVPPPGS